MKPIDAEAILELACQSTEQVALLSRVGEVLYGDRWQTQLAEALFLSATAVGGSWFADFPKRSPPRRK